MLPCASECFRVLPSASGCVRVLPSAPDENGRAAFGDFRGLSDLEELPFIDVNAGVIELRRSHSGFSTTHTSITSGRTTRAAGPGTHGQGLDQLSNRLSSKAVLAGAGSSGKLLASEYP